MTFNSNIASRTTSRITSRIAPRAATPILFFILICSTAILSGCGGYTSVDVSGSITGLTSDGLVLKNGADTVAPPANATSFVFPNQVEIRSTYSVQLAAQPARQTCQIFDGNGTAGAAPVTIVAVVCANNTYSVGGTVTGLTGTGLVLTNGSDQVTVANGDASGNASFVFPTPVTDNTPYGVAVLTQPTGQACTVINGSALVNAAAVTTVQVKCI